MRFDALYFMRSDALYFMRSDALYFMRFDALYFMRFDALYFMRFDALYFMRSDALYFMRFDALYSTFLVNQCLGSIFMSTFSCSIRPSDALAAKTTGNMVMFFFVHKASLLGYLRSDALYCYALWRTVFYALWRTCLYLSCSNLVVSTKVH